MVLVLIQRLHFQQTANVNFGKYSSVFVHLMEENADIFKANCNCHVLNNCLKFAVKYLSFDVEILVIKVFNEFSSSAKKTADLKDCFEFAEQDYKTMLRHVSTRWLSL